MNGIVEEVFEEIAALFNSNGILLALEKSVGGWVSCSWDIDSKGSIVGIVEVEFEREANRLVRYKGNLNLDLLFCDAQVTTAHVSHLQVNCWVLLRDCVLQVDVLISTVDYLKDSSALLAELDSRKNEVGLIEVKSRKACLCANWNLHVASRNIYFSLVDKEL